MPIRSSRLSRRHAEGIEDRPERAHIEVGAVVEGPRQRARCDVVLSDDLGDEVDPGAVHQARVDRPDQRLDETGKHLARDTVRVDAGGLESRDLANLDPPELRAVPAPLDIDRGTVGLLDPARALHDLCDDIAADVLAVILLDELAPLPDPARGGDPLPAEELAAASHGLDDDLVKAGEGVLAECDTRDLGGDLLLHDDCRADLAPDRRLRARRTRGRDLNGHAPTRARSPRQAPTRPRHRAPTRTGLRTSARDRPRCWPTSARRAALGTRLRERKRRELPRTRRPTGLRCHAARRPTGSPRSPGLACPCLRGNAGLLPWPRRGTVPGETGQVRRCRRYVGPLALRLPRSLLPHIIRERAPTHVVPKHGTRDGLCGIQEATGVCTEEACRE